MRLRLLLVGTIVAALAGAAALLVFGFRNDSQARPTGTAPRKPLTSSRPARRTAVPNRSSTSPVENPPILFEDVTASTHIAFQHISGASPHRYQPEADGSGAAVFDFDGDGWMDVYLATCVPFPLDPERTTPHHVLYRSRGDGTYDDVSVSSGTALSSFGQGLTAGDYDNDGFADLYLTNYGPNVLFHNNGDGTFAPVAGEATSESTRWGAGCAFLDCDEDGDLDLYVCNYAQWTVQTHLFCGYEPRGIRTYCIPLSFEPDRHVLWRNCGDGKFTDHTREAGIDRDDGRGFGAVSTDVNDDGHIDLYIANDMSGNFLYLGRGDGTFDDVSELSGAALSGDGGTRASMGVDATDLDGDGLPELIVTNYWLEPNTLYFNLGSGQFRDFSDVSGLGPPSRSAMGWGVGLVDLDNDGWPDVLVANGHIDSNLHEFQLDTPYQQAAQLWHNRKGLRFELVSAHAGPYFSEKHVGRAIAFGDLDNDGRLDFVANSLGETARVLRNTTENGNHWIRFDLAGTQSNRDAVGTTVDIECGELRIRRQVKGGASYLSAHDLRLLVGIGDAQSVDRVTIRWPRGTRTVLENVAADQTHRVREPATEPR